MAELDLREFIRDVPDFPKKGIVFKDITTLLRDARAFNYVVTELTDKYKDAGIGCIASIESRGFIIGAAVAHNLGVAFIPLRKPGKLPYKTIRVEYELEYGKDALEIHEDGIHKGEKVLILDDLLATGGTARAAVELVEQLGGKIVGLAFIMELSFLHGRNKLLGYDVYSLVQYESEE